MAKFSTQYSLTENDSREGNDTSPTIYENIVIKDEDSDGIRNLGFSDEACSTQIKRKRKMPGPCEANLENQLLHDTVRLTLV